MGASRRWNRRRATSEENREAQLVSLAMDLSEKQLVEGTASSQVITHYLKLGSTRERLEQERLRNENELLRSKVEQLASAKRTEEMYEKAMRAMRHYTGHEDPEDEEDAEAEEYMYDQHDY